MKCEVTKHICEEETSGSREPFKKTPINFKICSGVYFYKKHKYTAALKGNYMLYFDNYDSFSRL